MCLYLWGALTHPAHSYIVLVRVRSDSFPIIFGVFLSFPFRSLVLFRISDEAIFPRIFPIFELSFSPIHFAAASYKRHLYTIWQRIVALNFNYILHHKQISETEKNPTKKEVRYKYIEFGVGFCARQESFGDDKRWGELESKREKNERASTIDQSMKENWRKWTKLMFLVPNFNRLLVPFNFGSVYFVRPSQLDLAHTHSTHWQGENGKLNSMCQLPIRI